MWDHKGKRLWSHAGKLKDHVDAVAVGNFSADPKAPPRVYWATSDEGFIMLDLKGNILKHTIVGHTQTAAVGKFRPDLPGLQYVTTNFWRNPGIVSVFDADGNLLTQGEPIHTGSVTLPVNWRGDGQEFVLLSGNVARGRHDRRPPAPGGDVPRRRPPRSDRPGAGRDRRRPRRDRPVGRAASVWIYTQDGPPPKGRLYAPLRNPHLQRFQLPGQRLAARLEVPRRRQAARRRQPLIGG